MFNRGLCWNGQQLTREGQCIGFVLRQTVGRSLRSKTSVQAFKNSDHNAFQRTSLRVAGCRCYGVFFGCQVGAAFVRQTVCRSSHGASRAREFLLLEIKLMLYRC